MDREQYRKYLPLVAIGLVVCLAALIHFGSSGRSLTPSARSDDQKIQAEKKAEPTEAAASASGASSKAGDGTSAASSKPQKQTSQAQRPLPPLPMEVSRDSAEQPGAEVDHESSSLEQPPLPPLPLATNESEAKPLTVGQASPGASAARVPEEAASERGEHVAPVAAQEKKPAANDPADEEPMPALPPLPAEKQRDQSSADAAGPEGEEVAEGDVEGTDSAGDEKPARTDESETAGGEFVPPNLPVDAAALLELEPVSAEAIRNVISLDELRAAIGDGENGLELDLTSIDELLDGSEIEPTAIYGRAHIGPYPFEAKEAKYAYKRFRRSAGIAGGKATLDVGYLLDGRHNSEDWTDCGTVVLRLELFLSESGQDRPLGTYDTFVAFCKTDEGYTKLPWLVEGPLVCCVTSEHPDQATLSFTTDEAVAASVMLSDGRHFGSPRGVQHVVRLEGLAPGGIYRYWVQVGRLTTRPYLFKTAPPPGAGPVVFAFCGDSREGVGGGMRNYMGMNYDVLHRLAAIAYRHDAEFFMMGGDLINGYTTRSENFAAQLYAWKQAMSGFWHERAVYPAMGNHEALLRTFKVADGGRVRVDRWPYESESAEAIFADAFVNPPGAPVPADPRRPAYDESVFAAQYGMVKMIAFNNNYWYSNQPEKYGGCPEGYIMDDQLDWIERELAEAEADPTVRYVLLFAQEPVFPCGGHVGDAMWYDGNNNVRSVTYRDGELVRAKLGIIEVRNRLARAVAESSKVAAVLAGDEHAYHRVLIGPQVPAGDPQADDEDGDGEIQWRGSEPASPLSDLKHATWYLTCGGGGAPYYSAEPTPWTNYWKAQPEPNVGYYYSSQENIFIFRADEEGISVDVYNPYGERVDGVKDLTAAKR